jgi:hypothetical protein
MKTLIKATQSDLIVPFIVLTISYQIPNMVSKKQAILERNFIRITDLDASLREMGSKLLILKGKTRNRNFKNRREGNHHMVFAKKRGRLEEKTKPKI